MGLQYPQEWKFDGVGFEISHGADSAFFDLIERIVQGQTNSKKIYETFKSAFGVESTSTDASWASSDLSEAMGDACGNAALYVVSFWHGLEMLRAQGIATPSETHVNKILDEHDIPLVVAPPELKKKEGDVVFG